MGHVHRRRRATPGLTTGPRAGTKMGTGTRHAPWHVRRRCGTDEGRSARVLFFVMMAEISVLCILGKTLAPIWVLQLMIALPFVAAVLVKLWPRR